MSILDAFKLEGKVALVTGSSRGLGRSMAVGLAEAGANIAGMATNANQPETKQAVEATGHTFEAYGVNLIEAAVNDLDVVVAKVVERFGRLDILVNNAGTIRRAPILEFNETDWDDVIQVNMKAVFFLAQSAARVMKEQGGGKIINIASMLSYQGGILVPAYTASKHAVAGVTKSLANELAPENINVNAIAPGYMETDNTAALRADKNRNQAILARIPAGRWGDSDDLKGVAVFLASAASDYMQGEVINVDGGWMSR